MKNEIRDIKTNSKTEIKILLKNFGRLYSDELGINLKSAKKEEIFKWFLASILFGARISETIAKNTYKACVRHNVLSPQKIKKVGWGYLVKHIMGEGGYVRYDGVTSTRLLGIADKLLKEYEGDLNHLHQKARDSEDLEVRLQEFKGIGPTTVNIFLRELRGIWKKANPAFSKFVLQAARNLGIRDIKQYWKKNKVRKYNLKNLEAALLRLGKDWCHKKKCSVCPLRIYCKKEEQEANQR